MNVALVVLVSALLIGEDVLDSDVIPDARRILAPDPM